MSLAVVLTPEFRRLGTQIEEMALVVPYQVSFVMLEGDLYAVDSTAEGKIIMNFFVWR